MRLFVEHGVSNVSVRDIAEAVGMKAPNLYAHFRSREDMVQELYAEGYRAYTARLAKIAGEHTGFDDRVDAFVRLLCKLHDEDLVRFRFLMVCESGRPLGWLRDAAQNPADMLEQTIAEAMRSGEIGRADPGLLMALMLGAVTGAAIAIQQGRLAHGMEDVADELARACLTLAHAPLHVPEACAVH